jgi:hypothetical protein
MDNVLWILYSICSWSHGSRDVSLGFGGQATNVVNEQFDSNNAALHYKSCE